MGLVNQGWFVRCDGCGEADLGCIAGRTRKAAEREARRGGFFTRRGKWFCSDICDVLGKAPGKPQGDA